MTEKLSAQDSKVSALRTGFKVAFGDMLSVVIAALIGTGVILLTYEYSDWVSFVSYMCALLFLLFGAALSYWGGNRRWSFLVSNSIMAFLCVMVSTDALKVAASSAMNAFYKDTPLKLIPGFFLENSTLGMSWWYIAMECVVVLAVMCLYRWFDEAQCRKHNPSI